MTRPSPWAVRYLGVDDMEHVVGKAIRLRIQGPPFTAAYLAVDRPVRENVQDAMWPVTRLISIHGQKHHNLDLFVADVQQARGGAE